MQTNETHGPSGVEVTLEWDHNQDADLFTITITPSLEQLSNLTTVNSSIQVVIPYNNTYNVSVVASNCMGNSNTVSKALYFEFGEQTIVCTH